MWGRGPRPLQEIDQASICSGGSNTTRPLRQTAIEFPISLCSRKAARTAFCAASINRRCSPSLGPYFSSPETVTSVTEAVFLISLSKPFPRTSRHNVNRTAYFTPRDRPGSRLQRIVQHQPGVGKHPVRVEEIGEASLITPPDDDFRYRVSTPTHAFRHSRDRQVGTRQPQIYQTAGRRGHGKEVSWATSPRWPLSGNRAGNPRGVRAARRQQA